MKINPDLFSFECPKNIIDAFFYDPGMDKNETKWNEEKIENSSVQK